MKLRYRLGLDLGTNSIGWCMYRLDDANEPNAVHRLGVRIFEDGRDRKTLASLAAERRAARQMRRRRDRVLKRRQRLIDGLTRFGLFPPGVDERKALQQLDPFTLRRRALDEPLTLHELGRAIFHLGRKRGFRSGRKDARSAEAAKEAGKIAGAIARLRDELQTSGARTVGEHLARLHAERKPVKARRRADGEYVLYLQRAMVADEFDRIWEAQRRFHGEALSEDARTHLRDTLLFQRKLRPVEPGKCQFERSEPREPLASPLQQQFRILQELNGLRLVDGHETRPLTLEERNTCYRELRVSPKPLSFLQLRRLIGVSKALRFTLEHDTKRKGLKNDVVESQFFAALGDTWTALTPESRRDLALLVEAEDDSTALANAIRTRWSFSPDELDAICAIQLPEGYGSLSRRALERIIPELERDVVTYDIAVERAGYGSHSSQYTGELHPRLPYYGEILTGYTSPVPTSAVPAEREFGRIPNPTVHIGLNQLRQLVNEMIRRFGHPTHIIVELAREFGMSGQRRRELISEQAENQALNEQLDAELERLGQRRNRENRIKLRLYRALVAMDPPGACCIYTGEPISVALLFSDEVEIDHILPFSRSLHDGLGNKLLCKRRANRDKQNRTPFEAFAHSPPGYDWSSIVARAERLLDARKLKLFHERALDEFLGERDFLDRQLTDTQYLSRVAREYLTAVCPPHAVWVTSGRLTGFVRAKLGLNDLLSDGSTKNRNDHRHHAVDAAVVGISSRSLIKRVADAAARAELEGSARTIGALEPPWPTFRSDLADKLLRIVVSHKPDRGVQGALHNETNYGLRRESESPKGPPLVGHRVPIESLSPEKLDAVVDEVLREQIRAALGGANTTKQVREALAAFSARTGIRRARIEERLSVIPIHDRRTGSPYRYVKGDSNYCYDIFIGASRRWEGTVVQRFHANRPGFRDAVDTSRRLVMRLVPGDMIAIEAENGRRVMRVNKISPGIIALSEHHEANVDARDRSKSDPFNYVRAAPSRLQSLRARLVGVDVLGYVNDPGFRDDRSHSGDCK
jgi:CRISPR-associated endonuclease Csn1